MSFFPANLPDDFKELEKLIIDHESQYQPLKKGTKAQICWNKQQKKKTDYSIVYLHGFKGTHPEGYPVHQKVANHFGCNLYLSRLYGHGQITLRKFEDLTSEKLVRSAADALRIGKKIGEKVILMGSSTGGTLALNLAATSINKPYIAGLILYSPLIHLYGFQSILLENRISRSLLRLIPGEGHVVRSEDPFSPHEKNIWYYSYQLTGALALGELVQQVIRPSLFRDITCPTFMGYYFRDKHNHDRVVSTSAIKRVANQLGTPPSKKIIKNFPNANSHVICNSLLSNAVEEVTLETKRFLSQTMGLKIAESNK